MGLANEPTDKGEKSCIAQLIHSAIFYDGVMKEKAKILSFLSHFLSRNFV